MIDQFQDIYLSQAGTIREAIDGGHRSFDEFIGVYERAMRFRRWIDHMPPDANLLREYYEAVTTDSWIGSLPGRILRWVIFAGLGLAVDSLGAGGIGTVAGLTVGAFDSILLDSLWRGWRPNQFIDTEVSTFVA